MILSERCIILKTSQHNSSIPKSSELPTYLSEDNMLSKLVRKKNKKKNSLGWLGVFNMIELSHVSFMDLSKNSNIVMFHLMNRLVYLICVCAM